MECVQRKNRIEWNRRKKESVWASHCVSSLGYSQSQYSLCSFNTVSMELRVEPKLKSFNMWKIHFHLFILFRRQIFTWILIWRKFGCMNCWTAVPFMRISSFVRPFIKELNTYRYKEGKRETSNALARHNEIYINIQHHQIKSNVTRKMFNWFWNSLWKLSAFTFKHKGTKTLTAYRFYLSGHTFRWSIREDGMRCDWRIVQIDFGLMTDSISFECR